MTMLEKTPLKFKAKHLLSHNVAVFRCRVALSLCCCRIVAKLNVANFLDIYCHEIAAEAQTGVVALPLASCNYFVVLWLWSRRQIRLYPVLLLFLILIILLNPHPLVETLCS